MPKHDVSFTVTMTIKATVDPDELEGFDGDSAEEADVEQYLKDTVLSGPDDFSYFVTETEADVVINGHTNLSSKIKVNADEEE
jgi:hypothetical protein